MFRTKFPIKKVKCRGVHAKRLLCCPKNGTCTYKMRNLSASVRQEPYAHVFTPRTPCKVQYGMPMMIKRKLLKRTRSLYPFDIGIQFTIFGWIFGACAPSPLHWMDLEMNFPIIFELKIVRAWEIFKSSISFILISETVCVSQIAIQIIHWSFAVNLPSRKNCAND